MDRKAQQSFVFIGYSELQEILGKEAEDEKRLVELIEEVPLDSIYYHTHSFFLRHHYIPGAYSNDFAQWVATQVRDLVLGERLSVVDPFEFKGLEGLREELISLIDDHLSRTSVVPRVIFGKPFYFKQSRIVEVPTGVEVRTLREFRDAINEMSSTISVFRRDMQSTHVSRKRVGSLRTRWPCSRLAPSGLGRGQVGGGWRTARPLRFSEVCAK